MSGFGKWVGLRPYQRHSLVLTVAGLVFIGIGFSYIVITPTEGRELALAMALHLAPIHVWGTVFIICGLLIALSSMWPTFADNWGYTVLTSLSTCWAGVYFLSILFFDSPGVNLSASLVWGMIGFLGWAVSGLVNPVRKRVE